GLRPISKLGYGHSRQSRCSAAGLAPFNTPDGHEFCSVAKQMVDCSDRDFPSVKGLFRSEPLLPRDPGLLDHFAPLARITSHAVPHFFRCRRVRIDTKSAELILQVAIGQATVDLGAEEVGHRSSNAGAGADSIPTGDDVGRKP